MSGTKQDEIARAILALVTARGPASSICPSEAARALGVGEAWRSELGAVRTVAARLAREGRIAILRKGKPVDAAAMRGVIRLRVIDGATSDGEPDPEDACAR